MISLKGCIIMVLGGWLGRFIEGSGFRVWSGGEKVSVFEGNRVLGMVVACWGISAWLGGVLIIDGCFS